MEDLSKKTVMEIKAYAKKNGIDLYGVSTKLQMLEVIATFHPENKPIQSAEPKGQKEKVAVYSLKNLYWAGLGTLLRGYNIVNKEDSDKWLKHKAVRIAEPEEVASYYGK